jgi:hypothetical protein
VKKFDIIFVIILMLILAGCQQKNSTADIAKNAVTGSASQTAVISQSQNTSEKKIEATDKNAGSPAQTTNQETNKRETKTQESKNQAAAVQNNTKPQADPKKAPATAFTLIVSRNKGADVLINKKITIVDKKSVLDYLRDYASVIDEGGFIKGINDFKTIPSTELTAEQKKAGILGVDWFLYQNDKKTGYGAADIYPENGDVIQLDYKEWTYKDLAP